MTAGTLRLAELVEALGGELVGDGATPLQGLASLTSAGPDHIAFVTGAKHAAAMRACRAGALIVPPSLASEAAQQSALIVTTDPYLYYARLSQWWLARQRAQEPATRHPTAYVHPEAQLGEGVHLGAFAVIESGARVGAGSFIGAHTVIGAQAKVGDRCRLAAHVTVGERCELGARCIVHSGSVIGSDGFGFAPEQGRWVKIEQLGRVLIGDDVEIGANCTIDRGALDDTVIEEGVKLDNLVHIAHNVFVGAHTVMAGCAAVAGSTRIGKHCTLAGDAKVIGHLTLADGVHISACSVVTKSILKPGMYTGIFPLDEHSSWEKNAVTLRQLFKLRERVRALERPPEKT